MAQKFEPAPKDTSLKAEKLLGFLYLKGK